jgi:endonuclease YncB( thermonuclease family)
MIRTGILSIALVATAFAPTTAAETIIIGTANVGDGDGIDLGPVRIRLNGIDAPEADQVCNAAGGGTWRCGEMATSRLEKLADGREARCVALDRDGYGRIIAECEVDGVNLNETMMRDGLAWAFRRYSEIYVDLENEASAARIGVWQAETQPAWKWREDAWNRACAAIGQTPPDCCPIKGNVSQTTGERIYHTPWSNSYSRTKVDETAGERWFCDEAQAVAAGWRPPRGR